MPRRFIAANLLLLFCLGSWARQAAAQAPTIDTGTQAGPGANLPALGRGPGADVPTLGPSPGGGGSPEGFGGLATEPGSLGGRPGPSSTRAPATITQPGGGLFNLPPQTGITAPPPLPVAEVPIYGVLTEPGKKEDLGPPNGLTLDAAIDLLLRNNLDLRGQFFEIPMAQADVLTASLRSNPVFYADTQLIPYGQYTPDRPGGQTQYDVNISYPLDVSHKRQARTRSAVQARRVLEAQYQDAVR